MFFFSKLKWTGTSSYNPEEFKKRRLELAKYTPSNQDDLPVRRMLDSYDSAIIPLGNQSFVQHWQYQAFHHWWSQLFQVQISM